MIKIGKISKWETLRANRKARREISIELNLNNNKHRVHKSVKTYTRKPKHKKQSNVD